jgi:hypothetical protein
VLLVFALNSRVSSSLLADNINAHIWPFQRESIENIIRNVFQSPHLVVATDMFEVENTELLKDVSSDLLVVSRAHLCKGVRRLIVEFLAFH